MIDTSENPIAPLLKTAKIAELKNARPNIAPKLTELEQAAQKQDYFTVIILLGSYDLFPYWQEIVNSKSLAEEVATQLNVGYTIIRNYNYKNAHQVLQTAINEHLFDFILRVIVQPQFTTNSYSLNERLFLLRNLEEYYEYFSMLDENSASFKAKDPNGKSMKIYIKALTDKMFSAIYDNEYTNLTQSERTLVNWSTIRYHYPQASFSCFETLAMDFGLYIDNNPSHGILYPQMTFTCYDEQDLDTLLNWAGNSYLGDKRCDCIRDYAKQMNFGKCAKLIKAKSHNPQYYLVYEALLGK